MRIAIGADHRGLALKNDLVQFLRGRGHEVEDLGAHSLDPDDDYVDTSLPVARAVAADTADRGIIVCGSGVGASITASKLPGIRAAVCHDTYSAAQGVQHDDMNVLCLGAQVVGPALARELVLAFVGASLDPHPRFRRRLDKLAGLEDEVSGGGHTPHTGA